MTEKSLDKVLYEVLKIIGPYANHVVIGGGVALLIYRYYFSTQKQNYPKPAVTKDLDFLIPRTIKRDDSLQNRLLEAGFKRVTLSLETPPVETYINRLKNEEIIVEFLTDRRSRNNQEQNVLVGGISAQPLSYIEMSRDNVIEFKIKNETKAKVVAPEGWIFHKALTFPKRRSKEKCCKNLYGIWYVGTQLGSFSERALKNLIILAKKQPKTWKSRTREQVLNWISKASPADWKLLEAQDPALNLSKARFIEFIEERFLVSLK